MKSFQIIAIIFIFGNLVGCQTPEPQKVIHSNNEEKDKYIEKVEAVVSESASAIVAVVPSLPAGIARDIIESQGTRLSGVAKPSVESVGRYTRMVKENDSKAVQKDKEEALKVDAETELLYQMVTEKDKEIEDAKAERDLAIEEKKRELKDKILWALSCLGMAISTAGLLVIAFTPFKWRGAVLVVGGGLAVACVWILDSVWFQYVLQTIVVLVVLDLIWTAVRWKLSRKSKARVEPQT
jgi:hypothetical protein